MKILVICLANVCRSPLAEAVLQKGLAESAEISSAGLAASPGSEIDPRTLRFLEETNVRYLGLGAKAVNKSVVREAELILAMEARHIRRLCDIYPYALGKTFLLGHWRHGREVSDPVQSTDDEYEIIGEQIYEFAGDWIDVLSKP